MSAAPRSEIRFAIFDRVTGRFEQLVPSRMSEEEAAERICFPRIESIRRVRVTEVIDSGTPPAQIITPEAIKAHAVTLAPYTDYPCKFENAVYAQGARDALHWVLNGGEAPVLPFRETQRCRDCGCTNKDASWCIGRTGKQCHWVLGDLCSACAAAAPEPGDLPHPEAQL
jgi:hypothetical protein